MVFLTIITWVVSSLPPMNIRRLPVLVKRLQGLIEEGAFVQRGERKQLSRAFHQALDWLMASPVAGLIPSAIRDWVR